jgi:ribosomal protein S6--L-glutamate ligase
MKIAILSRNPRINSTRRLREAALKRGHEPHIIDVLKVGMYVEQEAPHLTYRAHPLPAFDAVIPRIGASVTFYGAAVVRHFEQIGTFCLNSSHAIVTSRDKLRSLQVLSRYDIGLPRTAFVRDRADFLPAIESVGGAPVVIKLLEGTQGVGVVLAETTKQAEAIIEMLQSMQQNILIQKFVAESRGRDIRAFVVGDRVVGAMRRRAVGTEFRSNVHRGGTTEKVTLDTAYELTAVRAAQIMGLRVAGVDMLESDQGPMIMEVNSSPGLTGIEAATGEDIAGAMIEHLEQQAHFEEVDIRQRLTLASGYGVVEFTVATGSELASKKLNDSGLRERDITVLSIKRQELVIPVPRGQTEIKAGDTLLCYGRLVALSKFVLPLEQKPHRKRKVKAVEE